MTKSEERVIDLCERADRIDEIAEEMCELVNEFERLLSGTGEEERARAYVIAHLRIAIGGDHGYLDRYSDSMEKTAASLRAEAEDEDDDQ